MCNTSISIRILSPGNDGDVTQTNSVISSSIANISSTTQTVTQTIFGAFESPSMPPMPPVAMPAMPAVAMPAVAMPVAMPAVAMPPVVQAPPPSSPGQPTATTTQPATTTESATSGSGPIALDSGAPPPSSPTTASGATDSSTRTQSAAKPKPDKATARAAPTSRPSARLAFRNPRHNAAKAPPPRPKKFKDRRLQRVPSIVVIVAPQLDTTAAVPLTDGPAAAAGPDSSGLGGAAGSSTGSAPTPSKPRAPMRAPDPAGPFGFDSSLATGAAAHGSSSSLSGFALLLGALLVTAPGLARWLRAEIETRPRAPRSRRLERPG